ncbi:Histone deacetylase family, partial [human gut metagenome]
MWNKGLSYRERHGLINIHKNVRNNLNTDKNTSNHSLGLVFFPAFDWKISETHPERQE